ncbi:MAG: hypothetical protein HY423_00305 [Candidatus Lambdaproteobacteria bacterium]|nr:hypothetical protein [Candidatus Lambdaproteobacteria bacterium]
MAEQHKGALTMGLRKLRDFAPQAIAWTLTLLRTTSRSARHEMEQLFDRPQGEDLSITGDTRMEVRLRMAILELEHHLARLYPQIGKLACDLVAHHAEQPLGDEEIQTKVALALEYRVRLADLRQRLADHLARRAAE